MKTNSSGSGLMAGNAGEHTEAHMQIKVQWSDSIYFGKINTSDLPYLDYHVQFTDMVSKLIGP